MPNCSLASLTIFQASTSAAYGVLSFAHLNHAIPVPHPETLFP